MAENQRMELGGMMDEKPQEHPTLAEVIERALIWPMIEREMEILMRRGLIPPNSFDTTEENDQ